jgi:hypothetical protein
MYTSKEQPHGEEERRPEGRTYEVPKHIRLLSAAPGKTKKSDRKRREGSAPTWTALDRTTKRRWDPYNVSSISLLLLLHIYYVKQRGEEQERGWKIEMGI